jgi:hypothetical protein
MKKKRKHPLSLKKHGKHILEFYADVRNLGKEVVIIVFDKPSSAASFLKDFSSILEGEHDAG